jgi:hypothetical protein
MWTCSRSTDARLACSPSAQRPGNREFGAGYNVLPVWKNGTFFTVAPDGMDARCAGLAVPSARVAAQALNPSEADGYVPICRLFSLNQDRNERAAPRALRRRRHRPPALRKHERARAAVQEVAEAVGAGLMQGLAPPRPKGKARATLVTRLDPVWGDIGNSCGSASGGGSGQRASAFTSSACRQLGPSTCRSRIGCSVCTERPSGASASCAVNCPDTPHAGKFPRRIAGWTNNARRPVPSPSSALPPARSDLLPE